MRGTALKFCGPQDFISANSLYFFCKRPCKAGMFMKAQKLVQTVVLALSVSACHSLVTCTVGNNVDCPKGTYCYGGKNSKPGKSGICVRSPKPPVQCTPSYDTANCPLGSFPLGTFCLKGDGSELGSGMCIAPESRGQPIPCNVGDDTICPPNTVCHGGENAAPGDKGLCIVSSWPPCTTGNDDDCPSGAVCYGGSQNTCNAGEKCVPTVMGATEGTCQPLLSSQPLLVRAQFSSDCTSIELSGNAGIQPPATFASSTGTISTLCPGGVSGSSTGFSCPLSNSAFAPNSYSAQWTVKDSLGASSTSSAYAFQTSVSMFPMQCLMPSAVLGRDNMVGRQVLNSINMGSATIGSVHPSGGCWGGNTALRGSIAAGDYHTCALKSDGTVVCWGYNDYGQTTVPLSLNSAVAIAAGGFHTCALQADGTVRCWGENYNSQAPIDPGISSAVAIAAGTYHTCALKSDGTVVCWGSSPGTIPTGLNSAVAIAAGWLHTCALKSDGTVACWGNNGNSQAPTNPGLSSAVAIAAGAYHTCALKSDGTVVCWGVTSGMNYAGQTDVPTGLSSAVAIDASGFHTCALKSDGTVVCWGSSGYGQAAGFSGAAVQTVGQLTVQ